MTLISKILWLESLLNTTRMADELHTYLSRMQLFLWTRICVRFEWSKGSNSEAESQCTILQNAMFFIYCQQSAKIIGIILPALTWMFQACHIIEMNNYLFDSRTKDEWHSVYLKGFLISSCHFSQLVLIRWLSPWFYIKRCKISSCNNKRCIQRLLIW